MATQLNNRGDDGRIYQSKPADTTYQGAARSIGFNPVRAANSEGDAGLQGRNRC